MLRKDIIVSSNYYNLSVVQIISERIGKRNFDFLSASGDQLDKHRLFRGYKAKRTAANLSTMFLVFFLLYTQRLYFRFLNQSIEKLLKLFLLLLDKWLNHTKKFTVLTSYVLNYRNKLYNLKISLCRFSSF